MKKRWIILSVVLVISLLFCGCAGEKNKVTIVKDFEITEEIAQANHVRYNTELKTSSKYYNGGFVEEINSGVVPYVVVTKIASESYYWEEQPSGLYTENIGAYTKSTVRIDKIINGGEEQLFFGEELYVGRELVILEGYGISPENSLVATDVTYVHNEFPFPIMMIGEQYVLELWNVHEEAINIYKNDAEVRICTYSYEYLDDEYKFHFSEPITGRTNYRIQCGKVEVSVKNYKGTLLPHNIWEFSEESYQRAVSALEREPDPEITDEYFFEVKMLWETYGKEAAK